MTTITREQLIEKLQNRIAVTANYPGVEEAQLDAAIFKIALASLEAEPIGAFHIEDQQVSGTTDYIKDGEWPIDNGVIDVYAVPPASVVPEGLVKAVRFYEQVKRENPPVETGAWKDAVDWVLKEACKAVSMLESSREHEVISQQEKA
ncbi:protein Eaa [Salmonella enterica]|nr:protein Eaa [Salmonella enterica subsp. enterica serovar Enteritidis]EHK0867317.1 protein Eaa [Salmonella enterica]EHR7630910.1 protein Eaa [Salmonella enterica]ELS7340616.1 protein Eaa [Salmonella enterica]ELS7354172.1 protein Eaa [Salmonella enterica]